MRIQLERALQAIEPGEQQPPLPAAAELPVPTRPRRRPWWLVLPLLLVLAAALVVWRTWGDDAAPPASPTPVVEHPFTWDGEDPSGQAIASTDLARLCRLQPGEHVVEEFSAPVWGGAVMVTPPGAATPRGGTVPDDYRTCYPGWQQLPSSDPVSAQETRASDGQALRRACQQHSGFTLDTSWRLLGSASVATGPMSPPLRRVLWQGPGGWDVLCTLNPGEAVAQLDFHAPAESPGMLDDCPMSHAYGAGFVSTGKGSQVESVGIEMAQPVFDPATGRRDPRVTRLRVTLGPPVGRHLDIPVVDGVGLGGGIIRVTPPKPVRNEDTLGILVTEQAFDAHGRQLRSCRRRI